MKNRKEEKVKNKRKKRRERERRKEQSNERENEIQIDRKIKKGRIKKWERDKHEKTTLKDAR